jgi:hypothetical protein
MRTISAIALAVVGIVAVACGPAAPSGAPTVAPVTRSPAAPASPTPTDTPASPAPTPVATAAVSGFYVRASNSQALPPINTFNWLPLLTISDGVAIDGNVAIPAIYPGPLLVIPFSRSITEAGTDAIAAEAERLGLLDGETDFTGGTSMPGSQTAHLVVTVDGATYELIGAPDAVPPCQGDECNDVAGSPAAFSAFWQEIRQLDPWLADELGPTEDYTPERVAMLLFPPQPGEGIVPEQVDWPLAPFSELGIPYPGAEGAQCITVLGDDLESSLEVVVDANEITVFVDATGDARQAKAVVVVPGAPSPCPDEATDLPLPAY